MAPPAGESALDDGVGDPEHGAALVPAADPAPEAVAETTPAAPGDRALAAVERLAIGRTPDVASDDPWAEAGRKVLRFHLARMLARVPGVLSGEDAEDVHAMRVASRRMRAAWRVFGDGFERDIGRRYRRDLRALGSRLGAVRDLDVLIEILVGYGDRRSARERTRLGPLRAAWQAEREARRSVLARYLDSDAFNDFLAEYEALVTTQGKDAVAVAPHAPDLVRHRIAPVLWTSYGEIWAYDRFVVGADMATLHELRIAGKWLRYAMEFVREPMEPDATPLIGRVVALQDHVGVLHDLHVAAGLGRAFVATASELTAGERSTIERFGVHLDRNASRLRDNVGGVWKPMASAGYRRALGRAIARL